MKNEQKVELRIEGDNKFSLYSKDGQLIKYADEDYSMYFKHAKLKLNGNIEAIYLGDNPKAIIDNSSIYLKYDDGWKKTKDNTLYNNDKVRMLAIKNKKDVIVIIEEK